MHVGTRSAGDNFVLDTYVVEAETYVYLVQIMRVKSDKPLLKLSANMPLKFAVEKEEALVAGCRRRRTSDHYRQDEIEASGPRNRRERYFPPISCLINVAFRDACCCTLLVIPADSSKNFKPSRICPRSPIALPKL